MARRRSEDEDENTSALDAHYAAIADQMAAAQSPRHNPAPPSYTRVRARRRR